MKCKECGKEIESTKEFCSEKCRKDHNYDLINSKRILRKLKELLKRS